MACNWIISWHSYSRWIAVRSYKCYVWRWDSNSRRCAHLFLDRPLEGCTSNWEWRLVRPSILQRLGKLRTSATLCCAIFPYNWSAHLQGMLTTYVARTPEHQCLVLKKVACTLRCITSTLRLVLRRLKTTAGCDSVASRAHVAPLHFLYTTIARNIQTWAGTCHSD